MKILIAYDGTLHAKRALLYGIQKVSKAGGELIVLQVFDRSMFVGYDSHPGAQNLARREAEGQLREAKQIIAEKASGVPVTVVTEEGDSISVVLDHAETARPDLVLVPPRFRNVSKSLSCQAIQIPGTIMVPIDTTGAVASLDAIVQEAQALGASILLLGIVPIHLYSREEKSEIEKVRMETTAAVKEMKKLLSDKGITTSDLIRMGYPDEEILRAAEEHAVSLIMLPSGGTTPSELNKAAAILLDEPQRLRWPVSLLSPEGTA
jgi:nucleotide-binding universal stress UspA family protein